MERECYILELWDLWDSSKYAIAAADSRLWRRVFWICVYTDNRRSLYLDKCGWRWTIGFTSNSCAIPTWCVGTCVGTCRAANWGNAVAGDVGQLRHSVSCCWVVGGVRRLVSCWCCLLLLRSRGLLIFLFARPTKPFHALWLSQDSANIDRIKACSGFLLVMHSW